MKHLPSDEVKKSVQKRYGEIAQSVESSCGCGVSRCCSGPMTESRPSSSLQAGYSEEQVQAAPAGSDLGLGCGNPQAIAALLPGETVLDLGSGAGFDSFLAARQVGTTGQVIGVDMTPEMVSKARELAKTEAYPNVEFRVGEIESLPVSDSSVDVIISNCVINLSPDKRSVFREAFRVLKPKGRLAISDTVTLAPLPEYVRNDLALHSRCIAGALTLGELESTLRETGFENVRIQINERGRQLVREWAPGSNLQDYITSALIQAQKPANSAEYQ